MKILLSLVLFSVSFTAQASVAPIFSKDGKMATFVLTGMLGDPDAPGLWNLLKVPPENYQGKLTKRLDLNMPNGDRPLNIDCVFSTLVPNYGTCTLILRATPGMVEISPSGAGARLWLKGELAAKFAQSFAVRDNPVLFRSADGRLTFVVAQERGVVTDFGVEWK